MNKHTPFPLELSTTLSLRSGTQSWGSERRMALLAAIDTEGSITAAARKVGLSYKAAWDAVDLMNNLAGELLVQRITGGKRGGGAYLTDRARELVIWFQAVQSEHQRYMEILSRFGPDTERHLSLLHSMALQTSARNQFEGTVDDIHTGPINDQIHLLVGHTVQANQPEPASMKPAARQGVRLSATLTHASTERLALACGRRALAFIKAQAVTIQPWVPASPQAAPSDTDQATSTEGPGGYRPGLINCWTGRICHRMQEGELTEISLNVTPHIRITGFAQPLAADDPALALGSTAQAYFQASDILIGTLD